jgi:hypothetical protein
MDDPVHRRLRPARGNGLTSPDPVTAPLIAARPPIPVPEPGTRTSHKTSKRHKTHGQIPAKITTAVVDRDLVCISAGHSYLQSGVTSA